MELSREAFNDAWHQVVRALATATGSLSDGEELAAEAFARASALSEPPLSLVGWCVAVGRRAGIDVARRREAERQRLPTLSEDVPAMGSAVDDRIALLLVACDEVLPATSRMVLAMRLVLGLDLETIAAHVGLERPAAAARLTRAKRTLADRRGEFRMPTSREIERRIPVVLDCVHGMLAIAQRLVIEPKDALSDLADQAHRLAIALVDERPNDSEVHAVLAIIRLALARRPGRVRDGAALAPDEVDRSLWDSALMAAGIDNAFMAVHLAQDRPGRYTLEARIAALFTAAPSFWAVPWDPIVDLHRAVETRWPAPSATLSRLVAQAYRILVSEGVANEGRIDSVPVGIKHIFEEIRLLDNGTRAMRRDTALSMADLAWRTRQPDATARYLALVDYLTDPAIASTPMRSFCRRRAIT